MDDGRRAVWGATLLTTFEREEHVMKRLFIRTLLGVVALAISVSVATSARATPRDDLAAATPAPLPYRGGDESGEDETYSPFDEQLLANAQAADETTDPTGDEGTTPQLIDHADDLWAGAQEVARRVRQIAMLLAAGLIATGVVIMMFGGIGGGAGPQPAHILAFAMMGVVGILVWPEVMTRTKELCDATARYIDTFQFDHENDGIASATVRTFEDMGKGIGVSLEKPFWWQLMVAPYTQGLVYLAWFLAVFFYVLYRFVWQVGWLFLYIVGPFGMAAAATGTPTGIRIAKGLYMSVLNLACWPISISILFALLNLGIRDYAQDPSSIGGKQVMVALVVALMIPVTLAFTKQFLSGGGLDTNLAAFTSQMLTMAMLGALKMAGTMIAAVPAIAGAGVALGASAGAALKGMSALGGGLASAASSADEGGSGATATSGRVAPMPTTDGTARATAGGGGATPGVGAALLGVGRAVGGAIGSVAATGAETIGNMALAAAEAGAKESGHVASRYGVSDLFGSRSGGSASGSRRGARSSNGAPGYASGGGESGGGSPRPGGDGPGGPSDDVDAGPSATTSSGPRTSAIGPASTSSLGSGSGHGASPTERAPARAPGSGSPAPSGAVDDGATTSSVGSAPPAPAAAGADDRSATGAIGSAAPSPAEGGRTQGPAQGASTPGFGRGVGDPVADAGGASGERAPTQRSANLTGAARIPSIEELGLGSAFGSTAGGEDAPTTTSTTRTTFGASAGGPGSAGSGGAGGHGQAHGSPAGGSARVSTMEVGSGAATPPRVRSGPGGGVHPAWTGGAVDSGAPTIAGPGGSSYDGGSPEISTPSGGGATRPAASEPDAQASDDVVAIVEVDDTSGQESDVVGSSSNGGESINGSASTAPRGSTRAHTINRLISNAAARVDRRERRRVDPADQAHDARPPDSVY